MKPCSVSISVVALARFASALLVPIHELLTKFPADTRSIDKLDGKPASRR
jgi:hypothetical protein